MDMKTISKTIPATWRSLRPDSEAMKYCRRLSRAENKQYGRALAAALEGGNYVLAAAAGMLGGGGGMGRAAAGRRPSGRADVIGEVVAPGPLWRRRAGDGGAVMAPSVDGSGNNNAARAIGPPMSQGDANFVRRARGLVGAAAAQNASQHGGARDDNPFERLSKLDADRSRRMPVSYQQQPQPQQGSTMPRSPAPRTSEPGSSGDQGGWICCRRGARRQSRTITQPGFVRLRRGSTAKVTSKPARR